MTSNNRDEKCKEETHENKANVTFNNNLVTVVIVFQAKPVTLKGPPSQTIWL